MFRGKDIDELQDHVNRILERIGRLEKRIETSSPSCFGLPYGYEGSDKQVYPIMTSGISKQIYNYEEPMKSEQIESAATQIRKFLFAAAECYPEEFGSVYHYPTMSDDVETWLEILKGCRERMEQRSEDKREKARIKALVTEILEEQKTDKVGSRTTGMKSGTGVTNQKKDPGIKRALSQALSPLLKLKDNPALLKALENTGYNIDFKAISELIKEFDKE